MPSQAIEKFSLQNHWSVHQAQAGRQINLIEGFAIMPFELIHFGTDGEPVENLGYVIYDKTDKSRLAYITDTQFVRNKLPALDYLLIECNFSEDIQQHREIEKSVNIRRINSHLSLDVLLEMLNGMDLSHMKHIMICHTSDSEMADTEKIKLEVQRKTGCLVTIF